MQQVSSLPADDAACGWFYTSAPRKARPAHQGNSNARYVVLGAGFTGLACARQLALNCPNDEIILIEAQQVGFGTSGRNAGFAIDLPHDIGAKDYIGEITAAKNTLALNKLGQNLLRDCIETYSIDCQMRPSGKYQSAVEKRGLAILEAYQSGLEKLGEPCQMIEAADLPEHLGTSFYKRALFTPGTFLFQPAALVKGLADNLPKNVALYENTPITAIERGEKTKLIHANGSITADKLILANNIFGMHFGFLQKHMLPVFLYASLTRVLTKEEQQALGGKDSWGVIPAHPFGSTVRRTPDQRILMRNCLSFNPDAKPSPAHLERFKQRHRFSFEQRFPMLPNVEFEYSWSGCLALSQNHQGFFGELAPNIYGVLCCNGLGVTGGTVRGTLLADWLTQKSEHQPLIEVLLAGKKPNRLPPQPFLSLGVNATLCLGQYKAGLER